MIPKEIKFPIFRRTTDGRHFYCIEAEDRFTEIQVIGRKAVLHRVQASMYPERLRIQDMIHGDGGRYPDLHPEEWSELLRLHGAGW